MTPARRLTACLAQRTFRCWAHCSAAATIRTTRPSWWCWPASISPSPRPKLLSQRRPTASLRPPIRKPCSWAGSMPSTENTDKPLKPQAILGAGWLCCALGDEDGNQDSASADFSAWRRCWWRAVAPPPCRTPTTCPWKILAGEPPHRGGTGLPVHQALLFARRFRHPARRPGALYGQFRGRLSRPMAMAPSR